MAEEVEKLLEEMADRLFVSKDSPISSALALLEDGAVEVRWNADEAHPFGRAFRDLGIGAYLLDLLAYEQAIPLLRDVGKRAKQLGRTWMSEWPYLQVAGALARSVPYRRAELETTAHDLADTDFAYAIAQSALPEQVSAEISLALGHLDLALEQAEQACARLEERGARPDYVSALEIRARILLELGRAQEALSMADAGLEMAEEMGYLSIMWRLQAARARALEALGSEVDKDKDARAREDVPDNSCGSDVAHIKKRR